jgi:hypothetical protein
MDAPRFQRKDLLIGISFVGVGLALLTIHATRLNAWAFPAMLAWPLIFAGVLTPLKRPWLGFGLGALLVFAVLVFSLSRPH